ncbi:hypothetical protein F4780DRAFT_494502 [Xylariomycetidae sp. FL0641]|nr:hypothetical protein F4780DRAFT_494502 [Xylariomycetidae sp. FL0641]
MLMTSIASKSNLHMIHLSYDSDRNDWVLGMDHVKHEGAACQVYSYLAWSGQSLSRGPQSTGWAVGCGLLAARDTGTQGSYIKGVGRARTSHISACVPGMTGITLPSSTCPSPGWKPAIDLTRQPARSLVSTSLLSPSAAWVSKWPLVLLDTCWQLSDCSLRSSYLPSSYPILLALRSQHCGLRCYWSSGPLAVSALILHPSIHYCLVGDNTAPSRGIRQRSTWTPGRTPGMRSVHSHVEQVWDRFQ